MAKTNGPGLSPNTPVIIGVGFEREKNDDPLESAEPAELMVRAVRHAAADAGRASLVEQLESISVPKGAWQYRNPGRLIADALGCPNARSVLSELGVLQFTLFSDLCRAIATGQQHLGVITGGEARFRDLRSRITEQPVANTEQSDHVPDPDVHLTSSDPFASEIEARRGLGAPVQFFSIIESALRHARGLGVEEHRDEMARLYAGFSEIAARNPHAWHRDPVGPDDLRNPSARNRMMAFPYTKRLSTQWNVNTAVAILVCSVARAEALGLPAERWIFPVAAAESRHVVVLAQQRRLHSHPGAALSGKRALALAEASVDDLTATEMYSCFPSAVRSFARDLEIPTGCPWSVTGSMAFSGGPLNHSSLDGVARMVEILRSDGETRSSARRLGLVSNLSGIFGKQGCAVLSNQPNRRGYRHEDITDEVAAQDPPVPLDPDYAGDVTVVGYTVIFSEGRPTHAIAICDTPGGKRTVARSEDPVLLESMMKEEFCGRRLRVSSDGGMAIQ